MPGRFDNRPQVQDSLQVFTHSCNEEVVSLMVLPKQRLVKTCTAWTAVHNGRKKDKASCSISCSVNMHMGSAVPLHVPLQCQTLNPKFRATQEIMFRITGFDSGCSATRLK